MSRRAALAASLATATRSYRSPHWSKTLSAAHCHRSCSTHSSSPHAPAMTSANLRRLALIFFEDFFWHSGVPKHPAQSPEPVCHDDDIFTRLWTEKCTGQSQRQQESL